MIAKILYSLVSLGMLNAFVAAFDASANDNVAVYWGQNSGGNQERLSTYCSSDSVDIVLLSFLSGFPDTTINFSNQCWTETCPDIGADIKTCQENGKAVLLSLGGAAGSYGFSSDSEATQYAQTLWNAFGAGSDDSVTRPFGDAVVDGFDFDIENNDQTGYVALANGLRSKFSSDSSKSYYLSAAPQCPYPDASVGDLLANVPLDFAFIQFYNNYCAVNGNSFNFDTWADFAASAPNPDIKLFTGVLGAGNALSGFASAPAVADQIESFQCSSNFGGVSIWDASSAFGNNNYQDQIKEVLESASCAAPSSSATSSASSTSSATSSASSATSSVVASSVASSAASSAASSLVTPIASPYSNNTVTLAPASTSTKTNVATTVITVTSCSDHKCSAVPVTTGLTTVTDHVLNTVYTTYCPLPTTTETVTNAVETTVVTITSCANGKCTAAPVTTGLTTVTDHVLNTVYTTYCPVSDVPAVASTPVAPAVTSSTPVAPAVKSSAPVAPVVKSSAPVAPVVQSSAPVAPAVTASVEKDSTTTYAVDIYQYQSLTTVAPAYFNQTTNNTVSSSVEAPVSSYSVFEGAANANVLGYGSVVVAGLFAALL